MLIYQPTFVIHVAQLGEIDFRVLEVDFRVTEIDFGVIEID